MLLVAMPFAPSSNICVKKEGVMPGYELHFNVVAESEENSMVRCSGKHPFGARGLQLLMVDRHLHKS